MKHLEAAHYQWLLDAAGNDLQKLALLSILLGSWAQMLALIKARESRAEVLVLRQIMHEISVRSGMTAEEMETISKGVWGDGGHG